ncbi:hypothetical protein OAP07_04685 [Bacteroidia bacterium]|nr:hypothetical protein [Bacteroidia bacterium]MDC0561350.1 hypothetical protein [Bacteroidia bacterium]
MPCQLFIDVIEDSVLTVDVKNEFLNKGTNLKSLLRRLFAMQNRIIMLLSSNATDRYEHFLKTYPDITQRVPQKMVASYLGITPEALSRVRREISKK